MSHRPRQTCAFGLESAAFLLLVWLLTFGGRREARAANQLDPGLAVTFTTAGGDRVEASDVAVLPNVQLYVPAGKPPSPFLPGGKFSADWVGFISSDIRDNYSFQAELNGDLKLEINGAVVWDSSAKGTHAGPTKPVRVNKGTNLFKVHFTSPNAGDAWLRLHWSSKEFALEPIALNALTHGTTQELLRASRIRLGRELFLEFRCAKCHQVPAPDAGIPELAMDAPALDGIGSRRNGDWMARWIADPKSMRPTAHMPKMFHGVKAREDAEAVAAFLGSLRSEARESKGPAPDQAEAGRKHFETLHCITCHIAPGSTTENDPQKISFAQVREKFAPGALFAFLLKPGEHYAWIRMPDFKLTPIEAAQLSAFIESNTGTPKNAATPLDPAVIDRGRGLVQSSGCLNCHALKIENQFKAMALAELTPDKWKQGCLADMPGDETRAPQFRFSAAEREALQAFATTDRASLTRHVPAEFAERQSRLLRCAECHGKFDGFPAFDCLGGKLKPEWMQAFLRGEVHYKPRPWIEARMPAFTQYSEGLAVGLAAGHGLPPQTPAEPPIDAEAARIGGKLISATGGFFCVSCHAVGKVAAMQVFESQGVNLAYTGARVQKSYFHRWVRNPLRIDPATKMPVYFDSEGKSPLVDYYSGDAEKQIEAIWQYIRLWDKMPSPVESP